MTTESMFEASGPFPEAGWDGVWVGSDPEYGMPLEVLAGLWAKPGAPTQNDLKTAHKKRLDRRAVPLAVFAYDKSGKAWLFGPSTDAGVIELTQSQGQRLLQSALSEPDASSARTLLLRGRDALAEHGDAGVLLQGLFSDQQILRGLPKESGWTAACERGAKVLAGNHQDIDLVRALGFQHKEITGDAYLLSLGGEPPRAVAILLRSAEAFDAAGARFSKSPIYHGLEIARRNNVPWLVVARGSEIRLYPTSPSVGVGRRGATQTYFGLDLALIDESKAGYLDLAFSAKALAPDGSVDQILNQSKNYVAELSSRLRDRVYEDVVSRLSVAVAEKLREAGPLDADRLSRAYRLTLKILFRLLFQAYAEDIRVLPFQRNERYTAASLKQLARHMADEPQQADSPKSTSLFDGLLQVWRVVDHGDPDWGVPAYNGGLFGTDTDLHPDGAAIEELALTNDILGPALRGLLVDVAQDGTLGPVDFRSLDVRDFGTIYEGLLEAGLSIAEDNLADDGKGGWKVAEKGDTALVKKTHPYFHTKSGDRKATGSYFTRAFVVEHLLERSLDPAIDAHLAKVEELLNSRGDQVSAARVFFDFRVADLAMGSGHFLVAAISHIEQKFGSFLERHPIPGVEKELLELRDAAQKALTEVGVSTEIDRSGLLSRQIAKRCLYGVDINEIAVELSRLAIWVRTFVPGLPMSSLDHQLVWGNSLTGLGSINEVLDILAGNTQVKTHEGTFRLISHAEQPIREQLETARKKLEDAAATKESTASEVRIAQRLMAEAKAACEPIEHLMSAALAVRLGKLPAPLVGELDGLVRQASSGEIATFIASLKPVHFPAVFPEVFSGAKGGFDVLIGNPPWDKIRHEPTQFWVIRAPGLLHEKDRNAKIEALRSTRRKDYAEELVEIGWRENLTKAIDASYQYQGAGHHDLAKVFLERNLNLISSGGTVALVLPGGFARLTGWEALRKTIFGSSKCTLLQAINHGEFMFEGVHTMTSIILLTVHKDLNAAITVFPGANSLNTFNEARNIPIVFSLEELTELSESLQVPWLTSSISASAFQNMSHHPRLASGNGWITGKPDTRYDFSGSGRDAKLVSETDSNGAWKVAMARHVDQYCISSDAFRRFVPPSSLAQLERRDVVSINTGFELSPEHPPIVYRFPSSAENSRTLIATVLPEQGVLYSTGYAHGIAILNNASTIDILALLGLVNSVPVDWWSRRLVDRHVTASIVRALPLPNWNEAMRKDVGDLVAGILRLNGITKIAGSRFISGPSAVDLDASLSRIDALVANGFGVSPNELRDMFDDFTESEAVISSSRRTQTLELLEMML